MGNRIKPGSQAFVAMSRTRAEIWEDDFSPGSQPVIIYEKKAIPKVTHRPTTALSSSHDSVASSSATVEKFSFFTGRMSRKIDHHYAVRIAHHVEHIDEIYLVGGGWGKWSAVNNLVAFLEQHHPDIARHIAGVRYVSLRSISDKNLLAIARKMPSDPYTV